MSPLHMTTIALMSDLENAVAVSGRDLRGARVRLGLRAADLATVLQVSAERVRQMERRPLPSLRQIERYRVAIARAIETRGQR